MWTPPPHWIELSETDRSLAKTLSERFGDAVAQAENTSDMLTFQVAPERVQEVLRFLKTESQPRFLRLDDLTAVDESARREREQYPDFTLNYQLLSFDSASRVRLKAPLYGHQPTVPTITDIWPAASWYDREVYDMFGILFEGHPRLWRLLMPHDWEGHPLRKGYPDRATDMEPYTHYDAQKHQPRDAGEYMAGRLAEDEYVLNIGPHHVGTHGLIRFILALRGEDHHRSRHRYRLPPPGRGKDRRAPVLAPVPPLYRPGGLSHRGGQQPHLPVGPGEAGRNPGAGPGSIHPGDAHGVLPAEQPPGLVFHLRPGCRRHDPHLLLLRRTGKGLGHRRDDHRGTAASLLVPAGRRGHGPARWLEGIGGRFCPGLSRGASRSSRP